MNIPTLTILSATRGHVDVTVDSERHRVARRAVAVALDYMTVAETTTHPLAGVPLSLGQWLSMRDAMGAAELAGVAR